jgi:phosphoglycolate phosphatase-like HAD superfamily hydrolase
MAILDDSALGDGSAGLVIVRPVGRRMITHVIHDVDGTHSLIRDWPPVMSLAIHWAMTCGLGDDFDSEENLPALIARVGQEPLEETDRFCVETAGLSALTQMEFGIRRAVELGNVPADCGFTLTEAQRKSNAEIIRRIWAGQERFDDIDEPAELRAFIDERTPRLFRLYEAILSGVSRDRNTAAAWRNPEAWRVPGSIEFIRYLQAIGCRNYFLTGAVIHPDGGMYEEVQALGFDVGPGKMVEALRGSSWNRKSPKDEVIRDLCAGLAVSPHNVWVIGDGRAEIRAGAQMGAVTTSRLPPDAGRQREIHVALGTNYILPDFTDPLLRQLIREGD